jgi:hypothetical protein
MDVSAPQFVQRCSVSGLKRRERRGPLGNRFCFVWAFHGEMISGI